MQIKKRFLCVCVCACVQEIAYLLPTQRPIGAPEAVTRKREL